MRRKNSVPVNVDYVTSLLSENKAMELLENPNFIDDWSALYTACQHASVFQHPSFVLPWYRLNRKDHIPVVLAIYEDNKLCALLTLARKIEKKTNKPGNKLIGAGAFFALYQTWLVLPGYEEIFWKKGLKKLFKEMPGCSINLKSLPAWEIYHEMAKISGFKRLAVLEKHLNPVLDFGEDGYKQVFGKRHFRAKYNRLSKAGKMDFEKLATAEELSTAMETIEVFHNLRQGAAFNKVPFHQDKTERQLFRDWFNEGVLHVTALKLDMELIASVIVVNDFGKTGHLAGLITYSPRHAKLSPGLVHLFLLGQQLLDESFRDMKLSPGDDAYKERFCNRHEELFEIMISPKLTDRIYRNLRIRVRNFISKKGIRPMEAQVRLSKRLADFKNHLHGFWKRPKLGKLSNSQKLEFLLKKHPESDGFSLNADHLNELLLATDRDFELSRYAFLEDALERLENQEHCLTLVRQNELMLCIWHQNAFDPSEGLQSLLQENKITQIYISGKFKN